MQAIKTRYFGPGNVKGARIKASCDAGSLTLDWDHGLNQIANHRAAAFALADKLDWTGVWTSGAIDTDYIWVSSSDDQRDYFEIVDKHEAA